MPQYELVSFKLCPFVQRSVITLQEKQVPYEIQYIDLNDKPDWFLKLSPFGKVPILQVDGTVIFESAVINEFIDETSTGPRLHPEDPVRRAHNRSWIEFASALIMDAYRMQTAGDEVGAREHADACRQKLGRLEDQLGDGPLFNGERFSLVDAAAAPVLQRLTWCEELERSLDLFAQVPKTARWRDVLLERRSVRSSTVPEIRELYFEYMKGRGWLGGRV